MPDDPARAMPDRRTPGGHVNGDALDTFIRTCLDQDEADARRASRTGGTWLVARHHETPLVSAHVVHADPDATEVAFDVDRNEAVHMAAWDPARALREIEAKKRLLALAEQANDLDAGMDFEYGNGGPRDPDDPHLGDQILCALALPYMDRDGFDATWLPEVAW